MKVKCHHCGKFVDKEPGAIARARKVGMKLFCNQRCFGLSRRKYKTKAQKKEEKRLYDVEYRTKNLAQIKERKRAYFQRTYDPEKAAIYRKANMQRHIEYCRQPEYKAWKSAYDSKRRAVLQFGPFWESFLMVLDLEKEISTRATKYEIGLTNGTINKAQIRRREYRQLVGN